MSPRAPSPVGFREVVIVALASAIGIVVAIGLHEERIAREDRDHMTEVRQLLAASEARTALALALAAAHARPHADPPAIGALIDRTEYLRAIMAATCKPDGYGWRVALPAPPPGWPAIPPPDRTGAWASPP